MSAGDRAVVNGSVLARGSGSDISLHAMNRLAVGGRLEADRHIGSTAGSTSEPGELSIVTENTSLMKSLGGGEHIQVVGLNDVAIDSSIGPGCTGVDLVRIESKEGTLFVEHASAGSKPIVTSSFLARTSHSPG